jgi:hypothetical protein
MKNKFSSNIKLNKFCPIIIFSILNTVPLYPSSTIEQSSQTQWACTQEGQEGIDNIHRLYREQRQAAPARYKTVYLLSRCGRDCASNRICDVGENAITMYDNHTLLIETVHTCLAGEMHKYVLGLTALIEKKFEALHARLDQQDCKQMKTRDELLEELRTAKSIDQTLTDTLDFDRVYQKLEALGTCQQELSNRIMAMHRTLTQSKTPPIISSRAARPAPVLATTIKKTPPTA